MKKNKTIYPKNEKITRQWYLADVSGKVLGRAATRIATYLRGKHKALFSPHVDCGDFVIVINAGKVRLTGSKRADKVYFTHSGYPAGDKVTSFEKLIEKDPVKAIQLAVAGMLPKNRLGRSCLKKLKIYAGAAHPYKVKDIKTLAI